jgi:hypothetical protein
VQISWMEANLIQVAPLSAVIWASMPAHIMVLLAEMRTFQGDMKEKNVRDGSSLSDLCCSCRVDPRRWLATISPLRKEKTTLSFCSRGCDGSSSLLPPLIGWIDVIVVWARPPFTMSGALHGLDGKDAEASSTPHIIPGVGSEPSLRFLLWYK